MNMPAGVEITEIGAGDVPEIWGSRSRWGPLLDRAMALSPGRGLKVDGTPLDSVHAIRIQIKRLKLPLSVTSRQRVIYLTRLPEARKESRDGR